MSENLEPGAPQTLSLGRKWAYAAGMIPAAYAPAFLVEWLMYFYYPGEGAGIIYMGLGAFVVIQFIGRLMDSVSDPLVGFFSDKTKSRWGRRIPYIIFGTPPLALTMALVWFPITDHPSWANNIWLCANLLIFWLAYTVVVAPHLSLLPELAPEIRERNNLGGWLGVGEVLGMLVGMGLFVHLKDRFYEGIDFGLFKIDDGFKLSGIVAAIGIFIFFWLTWWFIREKPHTRSKEVKFNFYQAARETLKNPTYPNFLIMISMLRLLVDIIFVLIPYYTTRHLKVGEDFVLFLNVVIIIGAVLFFPAIIWASNKYGKKKVFSGSLLLFALVIPLVLLIPFLGLETEVARKAASLFVFGLLAPGAATFLVLSRVVLTDIMDFDEKLTGFRREAMYNGIEGLITKLAAGIAPIVVALCFFLFEIEAGVLVGFVVVSLISFAAFIIFIPYPIRK